MCGLECHCSSGFTASHMRPEPATSSLFDHLGFFPEPSQPVWHGWPGPRSISTSQQHTFKSYKVWPNEPSFHFAVLNSLAALNLEIQFAYSNSLKVSILSYSQHPAAWLFHGSPDMLCWRSVGKALWIGILAFCARLSYRFRYLASGIVHPPTCSPIWQTCDIARRHSLDILWYPLMGPWYLGYLFTLLCVCAWVCVIDCNRSGMASMPISLSKALWAGNWYVWWVWWVWCFRKSTGTDEAERLWKKLFRQQEP